MAQELVPPPVHEGHVHCADIEGETCPAPEHEHCHAAGECEFIDCQMDCDTESLTAAVELIVRFTRATRGWSGDLIADAQTFLREHAPEEMWP